MAITMVGDDDFKNLLFNSDVFVDKSLFIKELIESSGYVTLIARPRRFGKSLNINMLKRFLEIEVDEEGNQLPLERRVNHKLFLGGEVDLGLTSSKEKILKPLKIANHQDLIEDRLGQFPVISISFKEIKGNSYEEIEEGVKTQIINLFVQHRYLKHYIKDDVNLLEESQKEKFSRYFKGNIFTEDLKTSLRDLSELLFKHFGQKVYILIDEYDTPINHSYLKFCQESKEFELVIDIFRGILGSGLKGNPYLERGLITGILRIAKANLFSGLNNVREYTLLDQKFSKFYGFTQEEVDELLTKVATKTKAEQIKDWYNGYTFGGEIIYNPWSIMLCLSSEGVLDNYWIDSGSTGLIDKVILSDPIQEDLQNLLEGRAIIKKLYKQISIGDIESNRDIFYSLLVFAGYLNPVLANDDDEDPRYGLTIPNKEVKNIYIDRVTNWVANKLNISFSDYDDFIGLLISQKIDQFREKFNEYLLDSTSYHDLSKEKDYHNLFGGMIAPLARKYIIEFNRESGHGRFDHILIPRTSKSGDSAIIIEYKISKDRNNLNQMAKHGLEQITNTRYDTKVKQHPHVKKTIKIAMAFCGKEVAMQYQIDTL